MTEIAAGAAERARQTLLLMTWFSPSFPIGAFAFSHGLEWAQECGAVTGRAALENWIADVLAHGSGRADAIFVHEAWRGDMPADDLIDLAAALQPSRERYLEATVQGGAFLHMVRAAYPMKMLECVAPDRLTLPIAAGLCGRAHGIALGALLPAYLTAYVANLSSAAVRLGIVGQTDGQRVIAALHPVVSRLAQDAEGLRLDDLGSAALRSDLFCLQHETQYSRLFRS